jgi:glycosyltransferase involved in cell wall biosynthesis
VHSGQIDFDSSRLEKMFLYIRATWMLWQKARRVNVLHAFLPLTNFMGACAGYFAGVDKIVTSRRGLGNHQDKFPLWKLFDRISNFLSDTVTVNSLVVAEDTIIRDGIKRDKLVCIYNGLDAESLIHALPSRSSVRKSLGLNDGQATLIIVANLIAYKGHSDLLDAVAKLVPRFPDICLLVVGEDRGIGAQLSAQAENLHIDKNIQWLGLRRDIPELLAAADIYICASHEEGFSNSLLEALAAGKAVVATKVGGNMEMLEDGALGLLVEPHDSDELYAALDKLLSDVSIGEQFRQMSPKVVSRRYGVSHMAEQYLALYNVKT